jgi:hypothetical protein
LFPNILYQLVFLLSPDHIFGHTGARLGINWEAYFNHLRYNYHQLYLKCPAEFDNMWRLCATIVFRQSPDDLLTDDDDSDCSSTSGIDFGEATRDVIFHDEQSLLMTSPPFPIHPPSPNNANMAGPSQLFHSPATPSNRGFSTIPDHADPLSTLSVLTPLPLISELMMHDHGIPLTAPSRRTKAKGKAKAAPLPTSPSPLPPEPKGRQNAASTMPLDAPAMTQTQSKGKAAAVPSAMLQPSEAPTRTQGKGKAALPATPSLNKAPAKTRTKTATPAAPSSKAPVKRTSRKGKAAPPVIPKAPTKLTPKAPVTRARGRAKAPQTNVPNLKPAPRGKRIHFDFDVVS